MKAKIYNVIVSEEASLMLKEHISFLARISPEAARKTQKRIIKEIRNLEYMPFRNPHIIELGFDSYKYRKKVIEKNYLIIYTIKEDKVYVDYILDCRQSYRHLI